MKKIVPMLVLLVLTNAVFSQTLPLVAATTSPYYSFDDELMGNLQQSMTVRAITSINYRVIPSGSGDFSFSILFVKNGDYYRTYAKNLVPQDTADLFGKDILIDYTITRFAGVFLPLPNEMWVPSYYGDVLKSKDRETLTTFETDLPGYRSTDPEYEREWYDGTDAYDGMYMFFNAGIRAGIGHSFLIRSIAKTEYGYAVDCLGPDKVDKNIGPAFDWSEYYAERRGHPLLLLLYVDGDYLDMYMNDTAHKFGTLMRVKEDFIRQYCSLIKTGKCDLAKVQWPQRAPKQIAANASYRTAENLRLRAASGTGGKVLTTLPKGTDVRVLETGKTETIDDITAPWVRVRAGTEDSAKEGRCFGGYLEVVRGG